MRNVLFLFVCTFVLLIGAQNVYTPYADMHMVAANQSYVIRPSTFVMPSRNPGGFRVLQPCNNYDDVGPGFVVRLTMGVFVDFFRLTDFTAFFAANPSVPTDTPATLCTFLTTSVQIAQSAHYDWTNALINPFVTNIPSLVLDNPQIVFMGGSAIYWLETIWGADHPEYLSNENPSNVRQTISIWGSNTNPSPDGCCYASFSDNADWGKDYKMDLILFPQLPAPTLSAGGAATILVTWSRKYDAAITSYFLEQSVNGGAFTTVATLSPSVTNPFPVVVTPTSSYRFRVSTINAGPDRTFTSSPSSASAALQLSAPPVSSSASAPTGGGGNTGSAGGHTGGSSGGNNGGGVPPAPTGPVIVVVNPSNYDQTPVIASPYVDVILIEQLLDGTQGRDAIWYTYTPLDKTPIDPDCKSYPPIGTRSLGGTATIPITAGVVIKAVACSKDGQPVPSTSSGFTGPWNRPVTPILTAIIPVQAEGTLTHPSYMGTPDDATVAAVVIGNTTTVSFHSSTNNAGFSYLNSWDNVPQCPPYTAPQPSMISLSSSVDMVVVTCAPGVIPSQPLYVHIVLFVAEPVIQAFAPTDSRGAKVLITSATWGANFVYTTDGSTPRCNGNNAAQSNYDNQNGVYVSLDATTGNGNLTVVSCRNGLSDSDAVHYMLNIGNFSVVDPEITVLEGVNPLGGDVRVQLTTATAGATLWYTLDGVTTPTCKASVGQSSPVAFVVYRNVTVQVVACLVAGSPPITYASHVITQLVAPGETRSGDSDGDGVLDALDDCPSSLQVNSYLSIDTCQPGVLNQLLAPYPDWSSKHLPNKFNFHLRYGCTMRDVIDLCENVAMFSPNVGQAFQDYLACVEAHSRIWSHSTLTKQNAERIMGCVAQAPFPSSSP